ncbi:MAG: aspartate aminotransferase family protein, partial [Actinomycetes bacterium]
DAVYATVDQRAAEVSQAVSAALSHAGVAHRVQNAGSLFSVFFTEGPVADYAAAQAQETFRYKAFFHSMLSQGVYLPPSAFEAWFLSAAHDDAAISRVVEALPAAAAAAASATSEIS